MTRIIVTLTLASMAYAENYSATRARIDGVEVVQLTDARAKTEVSIAVTHGNTAYRMMVNGKNAFWFRFPSVAEWKAAMRQGGNPFLAPWANRLDQDAFYANGKKYILNDALGNVRRDPHKQPIHGLLLYSDLWEVASLEADGRSARLTSRLEFWKYPGLMAQFPFAHTIEVTHRLEDGRLEVETVLRNHAVEPMPVAVGYHPYFQVHDAPRSEWKLRVAAREHVLLSERLVPTGEREPVKLPEVLELKDAAIDDVFTGLVRDADGRAEFYIQGNREKVSVIFGPNYTVAVIYSPRDSFVAIEPMSAPTNAFNLAHAGIYKELQSISPGDEWRESFWVAPSGF
ncbi:MAG: aldose 1-epimerase [Bryobacteraceae bacterium]|nr:aldose 1-epimerase [Bryobacteraceae bacterium]